MLADLDSLLTALYVPVDDFLPVRSGAGRRPKITDAAPRVRRSSALSLPARAAYGYCASHSRYFWGLRLYLLCAPDGMPISFALAPANEGEREVAAAMLDRARREGLLTGGDDHPRR